MSKKYSDKTLAYYAELPLTRFINGGDTHVKYLAAKSQAMKQESDDNDTEVHPEHEAVSFYTMNHLVAEIAARYHKHEPLPNLAVDTLRTYHRELSHSAVRAFHYLILICIREARHAHWNGNSYVTCAQKFGKATATFIKENGGEDGIMKAYFSKPPETRVGNLAAALSWVFYNAGFSSAFGGPKWGNIADCLYRYITGAYSAEMMLDTNWTLAHNGGPIFNKGYLYHNHKGGVLVRILDCQRAGVMPTAVVRDAQIAQWTHGWVQSLVALWNAELGGKLVEDKVDWNKVVTLGAVGHYPEVTVQKPKGVAPHTGFSKKPMHTPAVPGVLKPTVAVPTYNSNTHYQVMAGVLVAKTPRPKKV